MVKLKQLASILGTAVILAAGSTASADPTPIYIQNFDGVTQGGAAPGMTVINRSTLPTNQWGGGNSSVFAAQSGAVGSYFSDSFEATGGTTGAISDWLLTPLLTLANNYTFSFYARTDAPASSFADSLELRLCTGSPCTNVGTTPTSVGLFTTVMLTINPTFSATGFPSDWTQFTATIGGLGFGTTSGRFALRYFVDDVSEHGNYIGIDSIVVSAVPEPESLLLVALGLSAMAFTLRRKASK